jgi:hypothetical protein
MINTPYGYAPEPDEPTADVTVTVVESDNPSERELIGIPLLFKNVPISMIGDALIKAWKRGRLQPVNMPEATKPQEFFGFTNFSGYTDSTPDDCVMPDYPENVSLADMKFSFEITKYTLSYVA